ncbi:MAG: fumarylacetoacetase [Motiliproteus sp.]|nr:fumarylacetoacetase [Motiliproteus sp.]MCW9054218.1 fumarylacetoacetase [Motiliproteus sp.]
MVELNETHDPTAKSWLDSANRADTDFPIQNLPYCSFKRRASEEGYRVGVGIGDQIIDLKALACSGVFSGSPLKGLEASLQSQLNLLMAQPHEIWCSLRLALFRALRQGAGEVERVRECLVPQQEVEYQLPCQIGDYTDFYCSIHHATAVGSLFRPDNPLLPNYKWIPIAYHGRSSSIVVSGQNFHRPHGQLFPPGSEYPTLAPCKRLDYELEVGILIGGGNTLGRSIPLDEVDKHIFGYCLLNDWSARDIQAWEYQPLGPFLAKSFASTLSPWIVTNEALAPYRCTWNRPKDDPQPLVYLESPFNRQAGAFDMDLQVLLETDQMRKQGCEPSQLSHTNFRHCYWTTAQMVAHHTVSGCNLQPGDLLGSGTQSGPSPEEAGSLLELSQGGKHQIELCNGELRTFLEDGDTVILRGWCDSGNGIRIGFGDCRGTVLPARC